MEFTFKTGIKKTESGSLRSYGIYVPKKLNEQAIIKDSTKGEVPRNQVRFPTELGEEHPFDMKTTEAMYRNFGFVTGVIDKYVDFMVGAGFFVESEDERAKTIIVEWMKDVNFDTILRDWIKEGLVKGNGYLELGGAKGNVPGGIKLRDAKFMYIQRDEKGNVEGFSQFKGGFERFDKSKTIQFKEYEIAHIAYNRIGNEPYGVGIVYPALDFINKLLGAQKEMHKLMERKANSPIWAKMGSMEHNDIPSSSDIDAFGQKLEWLRNEHEWATGPNVDMKVLDFGPLGDKFIPLINSDIDMLFFTFQVPEVLMGRGSIPEGLAGVQMDAFKMRMQSLQAETEKIIEEKIFKRILNANGIEAHVEFEWGEPSNKEKTEKLTSVVSLLNIPTISFAFQRLLEKEAARLVGFSEADIETAEEEKSKEAKAPQPPVPGQQRQFFEDYQLTEWLGFNYRQFIEHIKNFIDKDEFKNLKAENATERMAGYLSQKQIVRLKEVLKDGFKEGKSIRKISREISEKVKVPDLLKIKDNQLEKDEFGNPIISLGKDARSIMIARTETTRTAAEGSLSNYKEGGVKKVRFLSSTGPRTCEICEGMNGEIYEENEASGVIPVHADCRCAWLPVIE